VLLQSLPGPVLCLKTLLFYERPYFIVFLR
jgi:hypothetical protein